MSLKRFYLTLILHKLMKEHTVWNTADVFNVTRGFVQNLLTSASSFASCMVHFTRVSWHASTRAGKLTSKHARAGFVGHTTKFKQIRQRGQRERHETIGFNELINALHVRFKFCPRQNNVKWLKVLWRKWAHDGKFIILCLNLNTVLPILFQDSSATLDKLNELE